MDNKKEKKSRDEVLEDMFDIMATLYTQVKKHRALKESIADNTAVKEQLLDDFIHVYKNEIKLCPAQYNLIMHYYGLGKYKNCSKENLARVNSMPLETVNAVIEGGLKKINSFFYSEINRSGDYELFRL